MLECFSEYGFYEFWNSCCVYDIILLFMPDDIPEMLIRHFFLSGCIYIYRKARAAYSVTIVLIFAICSKDAAGHTVR